jgi:hypothetical protein
MADVLADAVMVTEARKDELNGSGALQSFCWFTLSIGGALGAPLGGISLEYLSPQTVIAIVSICPTLLCVAAFRLSEDKYTEAISCTSTYTRLCNLCKVVAKPEIYKSLLFILCSNAIVPGLGSLMNYFLIDDLEFSPTFISFLSTLGYLGLGLGSALYYS